MVDIEVVAEAVEEEVEDPVLEGDMLRPGVAKAEEGVLEEEIVEVHQEEKAEAEAETLEEAEAVRVDRETEILNVVLLALEDREGIRFLGDGFI